MPNDTKKNGLSGLGIFIDATTGLATLDDDRLDAALAQDKYADARTLVDFAKSFTATTANLNAKDNAQEKQLANLHRAIDWIDCNRDAVQQEFGVGKSANPTSVFSKAAAAYDLFVD